jgi:hypothetical protein
MRAARNCRERRREVQEYPGQGGRTQALARACEISFHSDALAGSKPRLGLAREISDISRREIPRNPGVGVSRGGVLPLFPDALSERAIRAIRATRATRAFHPLCILRSGIPREDEHRGELLRLFIPGEVSGRV